MQTFSEALGLGKFHPEVKRIHLDKVLGRQFTVLDARIVRNFTGSKFSEKSTFALLLLENGQGEKANILCGGEVVVERVQEALDQHLLPLLGTITKQTDKGERPYYTIT